MTHVTENIARIVRDATLTISIEEQVTFSLFYINYLLPTETKLMNGYLYISRKHLSKYLVKKWREIKIMNDAL